MSFYLDIDEDAASRLLDTEETGITRSIPHARRYLNNAVSIWAILESEKSARLKNILQEELRYSPPQAQLRIKRDQIERLKDHIHDIKSACVGTIMDEHYRVFPDKIGYVEAFAPGLAASTTDGRGNAIHVLDRITEIEWLCAFFEAAIALDCDIIES